MSKTDTRSLQTSSHVELVLEHRHAPPIAPSNCTAASAAKTAGLRPLARRAVLEPHAEPEIEPLCKGKGHCGATFSI